MGTRTVERGRAWIVASAAPRLLLTGEDPVLLAAMARVINWTRPAWAVEIGDGLDGARRALRERTFDVLVATVEERSEGGAAILRAARLHHPGVLRVAYRTCSSCDAKEVRMSQAIVPWPADLGALLDSLDAVIEGASGARRVAASAVTVPAPADLR